MRARAARLDAVGRAALAEALAGNMSTHVAYCVRASERAEPADPMADDAVPIAREMPADEVARAIRPDGTLSFLFDGLRAPVPLPPLAGAILRLIDGTRTVHAIAATLAGRGIDRGTFNRAWRETWDRLSAVNRILLRPPP